MSKDWSLLSEGAQLALSRAALAQAADTIAGQAETLAEEMEMGALDDHGGPDALRLLAAVLRSLNPMAQPAAGMA
ncbi:MAG: hypothetical protein IT555_18080 [Acetobacteraceae bacterium]|nr:hypothetical protein [Acetobacteraceae bacterium]